MKSMLKGVIIALLAILTLYQTSKLWFEDRPLSDVFSQLNLTNEFKPAEAELDMLKTPTRILAGMGENRFISLRNDLAVNEVFVSAEDVIAGLLKNGEYIGSYAFDANKIFDGKAIILCYEYGLLSDVFTQCFQSKSSLISSRIDIFKYLSLIEGEGETTVYFSDDEYMHEFRVNNSGSVLNLAASASSPLYYELNESGEVFDGFCFVPKWDGAYYEYRNINVSNPFAQDDSVTGDIFESRASIFFDNPSSVWYDNPNDVYTLSDENTIVKYYSNSLLEYSSYKTVKGRAVNSFLSAFSAAYDMLARDSTIKNEVFLAAYSFDGESWHFGFDFALNDMTFFFSNDIKQEVELEHIIEITVADDVVTKYRRYVAAYEVDETLYAQAYMQILDVVKPMLSSDEVSKSLVKDLILAYRIEKSKQLSPYWEINISDAPPFVLYLE